MGAACSRGREVVAEKLGGREPSTYDPDWLDDCLILENTGAGSEQLIRAVRDEAAKYWVPSLRSADAAYLSDEVGEAASKLAASVAGFRLGDVLLQLARVERVLGIEQKNYARDVDLNYAAPLNHWLHTRDEGYRAARAELERRRLEMDGTGWAAKGQPPSSPAVAKANVAVALHAAQMDKVQEFLDKIRMDHLDHLALLSELISLQRNLSVVSAQEFRDAQTAIAPKATQDFDFKKSSS